MLQEVTTGLDDGTDRFVIVDNLHIHDTQSGLMFNMPDNPEPFKVTIFETGVEIAHKRDFMGEEKEQLELLNEFGLLKEKLMEVYEGIAEAKRNNLVEIFNTIPTE